MNSSFYTFKILPSPKVKDNLALSSKMENWVSW